MARKNVHSNPCFRCNGRCCQHVALPIDTPKTAGDFDDIRWYLTHRQVSVFVEDGDWYIQFKSKCRHLNEQMRCDIYATRPRICRKYNSNECEFTGDDDLHEHEFSRVEDIDRYAKEYLRKKQRRAAARSKTTRNRKK